jgi:hypothetical protein
LGQVLQEVFPEWPRVQSAETGRAAILPKQIGLVLTRWILQDESPLGDTMSAVFRRALDFLARPHAGTGYSAESLLEHVSGRSDEESAKDRELLLERLETIRQAVVNDEDPAALFQTTRSPVLRGLLLFLLDSEYRTDRALPRGCAADPQDSLVAEALRGALNGWSRVPVGMRGHPQAEVAVGYAMARIANRIEGSVPWRGRSFKWVDEGAVTAEILEQLSRIVRDKVSSERLRILVDDCGAQELEIRIIVGRAKKSSALTMERALKRKGKKATITFTVILPWN